MKVVPLITPVMVLGVPVELLVTDSAPVNVIVVALMLAVEIVKPLKADEPPTTSAKLVVVVLVVLKLRAGPSLLTVPVKLRLPEPNVKVVLAPKVIAPKVMAVLVVFSVPLRVTTPPTLAVFKPPVYVWVPPDCPKVRVPVLRKETALVIVPVAPLSATLATVLGTVKVAGLTAPLKLTVPPIFWSAKVPKPLTVEPLTSAPAIPLPVCKVKVLLPKVTVPKVRSPAVVVALVLRVVSVPTVIAPKVMAVLVVFSVPLRVALLGAVATNPPV